MSSSPLSFVGPPDTNLQRAGEGRVTPKIPQAWRLPIRFVWLLTACVAIPIMLLDVQIHWQTQRANLPADTYVSGSQHLVDLLNEVVIRGSFAAVAVTIFWRKSDEWLALFVALTLVAIGSATDDATMAAMPGAWGSVAEGIALLGWTSIWLVLYVFPDGRFTPRWTRFAAIGFLIWQLLGVLATLFPQAPFNPFTLPWVLDTLFGVSLTGSGLFAQFYRYWRVSGPVQRQQTKWVVVGFATALSSVVISGALRAMFPWWEQSALAGVAAVNRVLSLALVCIPVSIGMAVLRYRLWGLDPIINRTLVYGALTAVVVGIYVVAVVYLAAIFRAEDNLAISLLATGLVAVLFAPLRDWLQRGVNRLMYGERDEPYQVLARLGQRLEGTLDPEAVLPTVVETVGQALKLRYVAIAIRQEGGWSVLAEWGTVQETPLSLPLVYSNQTVGQLLLGSRGPGEPLTAADQRLLADLARHVGVATHAVRLTANLRQANERLRAARESLVMAREEERRRLRRDLHDGLGPQLAGFTLRLDAARNLLRADPDAAEGLLVDVSERLQTALADIRRLVYALRPPALDELGLVPALRQHIAQYGATGLRVMIDAPEPIQPLPAAVEVAAYRIVAEALTNVMRHARATTCAVRVAVENSSLALGITDDGQGIAPGRPQGVGLRSMRERAEELGGRFEIESAPGMGTTISVRLPLPVVEPDPRREAAGE